MKIIAPLFYALLIFPCASFAMEEAEEPNPLVPVETSVFVPSRLGTLKLFHDQKEKDFYVEDSETLHKVKAHEIDPLLKRAAKAGALQKFNKVGYISINRHEDGEFSLRSHVRGLGGGFRDWFSPGKAICTAIEKTADAAKETIKTAVDGVDMLGEKHLSALENVGKNAGENLGVGAIEAIPGMAAKVTGIALTGYAVYKGINHVDTCCAKQRHINSAICELDNCLLRNIDAQQNNQGVPLPCEKEVAKLALCIGTEVVDQKIKDFNKYTATPRQTAEYELESCLLKNIDAPRTEQGVPLPCQKEACKLAFYAGAEVVDQKIKDFNKYTATPRQTGDESELKSEEKPKPKGWFW